MDNKLIFSLSVFLGLTSSLATIANFNNSEQVIKHQLAISAYTISSEVKSENLLNQASENFTEDMHLFQDKNLLESSIVDKLENHPEAQTSETAQIIKTPDPVIASAEQPVPISRGGAVPITETPKEESNKTSNIKKETSSKKATASTSSSSSKLKTELLDWKTANKIFSIGSVVEITDVYTKKTFKIKRTMGSNHADCEALTKEDAQIIKNIWGGFSWEVRPIIINVKGRKLAASMSSLPHAGVDSAPAYAVVNNRSEGYGTGENLDTIKGNGMNGHFDVHFLNSTRHKDGKVDSSHQSAIKVAANK